MRKLTFEDDVFDLPLSCRTHNYLARLIPDDSCTGKIRYKDPAGRVLRNPSIGDLCKLDRNRIHGSRRLIEIETALEMYGFHLSGWHRDEIKADLDEFKRRLKAKLESK